MTGPVIKLEEQPEAALESSRWRRPPGMADERRSVIWASAEHERCPFACGDDRRCMLREGHGGLHVWRSLGGLRIFEWA